MAKLLEIGKFHEMTAGDGTEAYCILGPTYTNVQVTLRGAVYGSSDVGLLASGRGSSIGTDTSLATLESFTEWDDMNSGGEIDGIHSAVLGPDARYSAVKLTGLSAGVGVVVY